MRSFARRSLVSRLSTATAFHDSRDRGIDLSQAPAAVSLISIGIPKEPSVPDIPEALLF
ncbi:hypothetical protein HMPREF9005_0838 [Actinomyces sp. oral taxon 178 str. F0338]|nr:hypothetical protein HMPREF9005_0838 [Actinomyces sp. oral taxon 178 str. F0338]